MMSKYFRGERKVSLHQLLHLINKSSRAGDTVAPSADKGGNQHSQNAPAGLAS